MWRDKLEIVYYVTRLNVFSNTLNITRTKLFPQYTSIAFMHI